jgi:hypothetical protein
MNINELKNIDFKNLDYKKILELVTAKKALVIQIVVGVVLLVSLTAMLNDYRVHSEEYNQQIQTLKMNADTARVYAKSMRETKIFLSNVPEALDEEQFSSQIADYANASNVKIIGFRHGPKKGDKQKETMPASVDITAPSYQDFLVFIKTLEESPHSLNVDKCFLSLAKGSENDAATFSAHLDILYARVKK